MKILIFILTGLLSSNLFAQQDRGSGGKGGNGTFHVIEVLQYGYTFDPLHCPILRDSTTRSTCRILEDWLREGSITWEQKLFLNECCSTI